MSKTKRFVEEYLKSDYGKVAKTLEDPRKALAIFKGSFTAIIKFLIEDPDHKLPIPGLGTFYLHMSPPRVVQGKQSKLHGKVAKVPHLKWRVADSLKSFIIQAVTGYSEEEDFSKPVKDKFFTPLLEEEEKTGDDPDKELNMNDLMNQTKLK